MSNLVTLNNIFTTVVLFKQEIQWRKWFILIAMGKCLFLDHLV